MNDVLRSKEILEKYKKRKEEDGALEMDLLSLKPVRPFHFWLLVENEYPYDKIAEKHHLLVPRENVSDYHQLSWGAKQELTDVRRWANGMRYDVLMENMSHRRTIKQQFHMHLIKYK